MPGRKHPLLNGHIYHIYNKSILSQRIFVKNADIIYFLHAIKYYQSTSAIMRLSKFLKMKAIGRAFVTHQTQEKRSFQVSILAYCIMPTHFHFLIKQRKNRGISNFISKIQNSYTKYYNLKYNKVGPIFLDRFKSKPILSDEVCKHVSRYIHLNPYSSQIVNTVDDLDTYRWSSWRNYIGKSEDLVDLATVLSLFGNDKARYRKFVLDHAEHQKTLEFCKYSDS